MLFLNRKCVNYINFYRNYVTLIIGIAYIFIMGILYFSLKSDNMNINLFGYWNEKKKASNNAYNDLRLFKCIGKEMVEIPEFNFGKQTKNYAMMLHNNNRISLVLFLRYNSFKID
jgi:hypothetical protein